MSSPRPMGDATATEEPRLISPSSEFEDSFLEALAEFQTEERYLYLDAKAIAADFDAFLAMLRRGALPDPRVPPDSNPKTILWLVEGDVFLGRVTVRHELSEWQRWHSGHIGYDIRPSARGRGLGHSALRLALGHAKNVVGLDRALLICNPKNPISERVIRAASGVFEGEYALDDWPRPLRHFWIDLASY